MSQRIHPAALYQINRNLDRHRLQINRIKSKSSPIIKKKQEQDSILGNRHYHQTYNSKFRNKQSQQQIHKKNTQIISKILSLSKVKRPNSISHSQMINRMQSSRIGNKKQSMRGVDLQNSRFVKKLVTVKSTINNLTQSNSFRQHKARSQMLSKFKLNTVSGTKIAKNSISVEKRLKLEPIHNKIKVIQEREKIKLGKPIKFNSLKLEDRYNPEKSRNKSRGSLRNSLISH